MMNYKRIGGIVLLVCGLACIGGFAYMNVMINEGKEKIASAEKKIEEGGVLLGLHPISRRMTKNATEAGQKMIDDANETIAQYEELSKWALGGGIGLAIAGGTLLFFSRKKKWSS